MLSESETRDFVARWAEVQNAHDFSAYSRLYAERFTGIKRTGKYTARFDRESWLRDRKPMLREGVKVAVSKLQILAADGATRVVFTQEFSSPGFSDIGSKELFLVATPTGIAISREEMLESRLKNASPSGASGVLAFHRDGVVLGTGVEATSVKTQVQLLAHAADDPYDVSAPLAESDVPTKLREWIGREVTVYDDDKGGGTCSGRVTRFEARLRAVPHFGMRQAFAGASGEPKATPLQIATSLWNMARADERFIVGVLDRPCRGTWATARTLSWTLATPPAAPRKQAALLAFRALPQYRAIQARFSAETEGANKPWETVDAELSAVELRTSPKESLLVVSVRSGSGCGGFSGSLTGIWRVGGEVAKPELVLVGTLEPADLLRVRGAVDENADGELELLAGPDGVTGEVSLLRRAASKYERTPLLTTAFWDCSC